MAKIWTIYQLAHFWRHSVSLYKKDSISYATKTSFKTKTKTCTLDQDLTLVLEAPQIQDHGLEDYLSAYHLTDFSLLTVQTEIPSCQQWKAHWALGRWVDNGADVERGEGSATADPKLAHHTQPAAHANTTTSVQQTALSKTEEFRPVSLRQMSDEQ